MSQSHNLLKYSLSGVEDVDREILANSTDDVFINFYQCNKYLNSLCKEDLLWKLKFLYKYNIKDFKIPSDLSFEKLYKVLKNKTNKDGLIWAANYGYSEVIKLLSDSDDNFDSWYRAIIRPAAINGHLEVIRFFLDYGTIPENFEALHPASINGHIEIVRLLLERGLVIEDHDKTNALFFAARSGHANIVKLLIEAGANIHAKSDMVLLLAAKHGHQAVVRLLLDYGANMYMWDDGGAIIAAAREGHIEVIRVFLEFGADVLRIWYYNALFVSREHKHLDIVKLLSDLKK